MRHLFLMDPIESVLVDRDSTFALMVEAQRREHEVLYATVDNLFARDGKAYAVAQPAELRPVQGQHARLGAELTLGLDEVDVVWMRKDPPFHMGYIFNTYLLDYVSRPTVVVNAPAGLRALNEKAWALRFPELVPTSLVTQSMSQIRALAEELGTIVVKPLDGNGGEGVFIVRADDPNIGVILEASTRHGQRKILAQRYLPEAVEGDKRIILVDGEVVGATLRVPTGVDHRGNIHVGARVQATRLTTQEKVICDTLGPWLKAEGQVFVGIDVIGDKLTEVNVTSPTGIHEINAFDNVCLEALIVDAALARRAAS